MKKIFIGGNSPMKKNSNKGFYAALLICVVLLGFSMWYSEFESGKQQLEEGAMQLSVQENTPKAVVISPAPSINSLLNTQTPKVAPKPTAKPIPTKAPENTDEDSREVVAPAVQATKEPQATKEIKKIIFPVKEGLLTTDHSPAKPVYSKTFEDWRVHKGIDISAPSGTQVYAVADAIVDDVFTDKNMGITIILKYGNYKFIYQSLSTDVLVKKGSAVLKGQAISGVGTTAVSESGQEPHIHFEMYKDDAILNPSDFFE